MANPRITKAVALGNFIAVRDRIAEILMCEFAEQETLQTDQDVIAAIQNTNFYPERFHPLNEAEMVGVAIYLFNCVYDNQNVQHARGRCDFFLDIYGREAATQDADGNNAEDGDKLAALKIQVIISLIRSILEDPSWIRLGFDAEVVGNDTFIHGHEVTSVQRTEPKHNQDAGNILMYRLTFQVTLSENTNNIDLPPLALASTDVRISETEHGYQYVYNPNP